MQRSATKRVSRTVVDAVCEKHLQEFWNVLLHMDVEVKWNGKALSSEASQCYDAYPTFRKDMVVKRFEVVDNMEKIFSLVLVVTCLWRTISIFELTRAMAR